MRELLARVTAAQPGDITWIDLQWRRASAAALELTLAPSLPAEARRDALDAAGRTRFPTTVICPPEADADVWAAHERHGHVQAVLRAADPGQPVLTPEFLHLAHQEPDWIDDRLHDQVLGSRTPRPVPVPLTRVLDRAEADPAGLDDAEYVALLHADGADLDRLTTLADAVRRDLVGDDVTYVVNRNLDPSLGLPPERIAALVQEAAALGATEICAQGPVPADRGAEGYLEFARSVKTAAPGIHLHAFRPAETLDGAGRAELPLPTWLLRLHQAGVDTVPGTAARILDDDIRAALTAGTDIPAAGWVDAIRTAHRIGLHSTATMVYGHVESPVDQVRHLRLLARIQDEHRGFTELIAMPFVPAESPVPVAGARPGPTLRESRAVHAVARLMLAGRIDHVQAAWTKLGLRGAQLVLDGGADDLGGVLLDGALDPAAGPEAGRMLSRDDVARLAGELGRGVRQRTTLYEDPSDG